LILASSLNMTKVTTSPAIVAQVQAFEADGYKQRGTTHE
jgi:hypothetical protein